MSKTVSIRVEHRAVSRAAGQRNHDIRYGKQIPNYVDRDRMKQNSILVHPKGAPELRKLCEERRSQRPTKRSMKIDAAVATNGIITFGTRAQPIIESLSKDDQNRLFQETANRIATRLNTDLTGLVVHRDESAIHAHFQLVAVNRDGMPLSTVIDRTMAKELQDIAGRVYADYGIHRGTPKADRIERGDDPSKIYHRSTKKLHVDLPRELEAFDRKIDESEQKLMKNLRLIDEQELKLEAGKVEEAKARERIEIYERRAEAARKELEELKEKARIARKETSDYARLADALLDGMHELMPENKAIKDMRSDLFKGVYDTRDMVEAAIAFRESAKETRLEMDTKEFNKVLHKPQEMMTTVYQERKKDRGMER